MKFRYTIILAVIFAGLLAFALRDKRQRQEKEETKKEAEKLLIFDRDQVRRLTLIREDETIVAEKEESGEWKIVSPVQTDADNDAVERLIDNIGNTRTDRVLVKEVDVEDAEETLEGYGLDKPTVVLHMELEGDATSTYGQLDTVYYGGESPTSSYAYVRKGQSLDILTIPLWRRDNVDKQLFDLRDQRVLGFQSDEVRQLDIKRAGILMSVSRSGSMWNIDKPVQDRGDGDEIDKIIRKLNQEKVKEFVSESPDMGELEGYGLTDPHVEVTLWLGADRAKKILYIGDEKRSDLYAQDKEDADRYAKDESKEAVFLISSELKEALEVDPFALRYKQLADFESDDIDKVEFAYKEEAPTPYNAILCVKDTSGNWSVAFPSPIDSIGQKKDAKGWKIRGAMSDIADLKAEKFLPEESSDTESALDLSQYGLERPRITVRLWKGEKLVLQFFIGKGKDEFVYAKTSQSDRVYLVRKSIVEDLNFTIDDIAVSEGGA